MSWRKDLQKCFAWMIPFSTRLVRACSTPALSKSGPQKLDTKTHKQKCTKRCRAGRYLQRFWCLVIICYHFLFGGRREGGAMINIHCPTKMVLHSGLLVQCDLKRQQMPAKFVQISINLMCRTPRSYGISVTTLEEVLSWKVLSGDMWKWLHCRRQIHKPRLVNEI